MRPDFCNVHVRQGIFLYGYRAKEGHEVRSGLADEDNADGYRIRVYSSVSKSWLQSRDCRSRVSSSD